MVVPYLQANQLNYIYRCLYVWLYVGDGRKSVAERELEVKRAELNREVAQMAEQLTKAATVILETEQNAIDATLAAQQACDEAQQVEVFSIKSSMKLQ